MHQSPEPQHLESKDWRPKKGKSSQVIFPTKANAPCVVSWVRFSGKQTLGWGAACLAYRGLTGTCAPEGLLGESQVSRMGQGEELGCNTFQPIAHGALGLR